MEQMALEYSNNRIAGEQSKVTSVIMVDMASHIARYAALQVTCAAVSSGSTAGIP